MRMGCFTCWAYFEKGSEENTLDALRNHLGICNEEKPYRDDPNADGYDDY